MKTFRGRGGVTSVETLEPRRLLAAAATAASPPFDPTFGDHGQATLDAPASSLYDLNTVWEGLFVLMAIGFVLYFLIDLIERRLLPWRQASNANTLKV